MIATDLSSALTTLGTPVERIAMAANTPALCAPPNEFSRYGVGIDPSKHDGYYISTREGWPAPTIVLKASVCNALDQTKDKVRLGWTIFVVGHEREHARGVLDETQADCAGARDFFEVAHKLGVSTSDARESAKWIHTGAGYNPKLIVNCWAPWVRNSMP